MKKIVTVIVIMFSFSCFAQESGMPPGGMPSEGMKPLFSKKLSTDELLTKMTDELNLDELQQLQIRIILKEVEKHNEPNHIKSGERQNFNAIKEKMETKKKDLATKLAPILTDEQFKKWNEESENWKPDETK